MKQTHLNGEIESHTEPLGLFSGILIFIGMLTVAVMIADVVTGFQLHEFIGRLIK